MDIIIRPDCTVSSKLVAEKFGKRHDDVLRTFRNLKKQSSNQQEVEFIERNFAENNINTLQGKSQLSEVLISPAVY